MSSVSVVDDFSAEPLSRIRTKAEDGVSRDLRGSTASAVAESRGDSQHALLTNAHTKETLGCNVTGCIVMPRPHLVPALDYLALAKSELQRLVTVQRRVELLAI